MQVISVWYSFTCLEVIINQTGVLFFGTPGRLSVFFYNHVQKKDYQVLQILADNQRKPLIFIPKTWMKANVK
jgi:hypothetical protein